MNACCDAAKIHASQHRYAIKALAASPDGRLLMIGSYGGTVAACDPGKLWSTWQARPTTFGISVLVYNPRRTSGLAATYDGAPHVLS